MKMLCGLKTVVIMAMLLATMVFVAGAVTGETDKIDEVAQQNYSISSAPPTITISNNR